MKYLLTIMIFSSLSSCSSNKKAELISRAESYLKEQMKDPSSFQVISSEIIDTTMMMEHLKKQYSKDTNEISDWKKINSNSSVIAIYEESANKHLKAINNLKQDSIYYMTLKFEYRAKNGFGALDKYTKGVNFFPGNNTFKIIE